MTKTNNVKIDELKWDEDGLIPAIVQDAVSKQVLMMAYMNRESLQKSLETGETWFWSRSRQELWHKGATSGNTQTIRSIHADCDADALLITVVPKGPACHAGTYSCFEQSLHEAGADVQAEGEGQSSASASYEILSALRSIIAKREAERPEGAYTTYLFDQGVDKILKKVGEESAEVIIAAKNRDPVELRNEASDLIYHLLVLLQEQKLPFDEVLQELSRRHAR